MDYNKLWQIMSSDDPLTVGDNASPTTWASVKRVRVGIKNSLTLRIGTAPPLSEGLLGDWWIAFLK